MVRYRYPASQRTGWRRYIPVMYAFIGWNVLGFFVWKRLKKKTIEDCPEFDQMTSAQKSVYLSGYSQDEVVKKKVDFSKIFNKKEEATSEELEPQNPENSGD